MDVRGKKFKKKKISGALTSIEHILGPFLLNMSHITLQKYYEQGFIYLFIILKSLPRPNNTNIKKTSKKS